MLIILPSYCQTHTTQSDLKSLIGKLNWATSILITGRGFLRRLIDSVLGPHVPGKVIEVSEEMKLDLKMWERFLRYYNGRAFLDYHPIVTSESLNFYTDASFKGAGGVFGRKWFQIIYPESWAARKITYLELYPIVVAAHIFVRELAGKKVIFHTDNYAVMTILNKCTSPNPKFMPLVRKLVALLMKHRIKFCSKHVRGICNGTSDTISRLQVSAQFLVDQQLDPRPEPIPVEWTPDYWQIQESFY